jgi:hypothetical protein
VNELFAQKRKKEAIKHDIEWWRPQPQLYGLVNVLQERGRALEEERRTLLQVLLGDRAVELGSQTTLLWHVQLTGAVLGSLTPDKHNAVQEICQRAAQRSQVLEQQQFNGMQPVNPIEVARHRDQTRSDLAQVLAPEEMEEFMLRYSQNAFNLRQELAGLVPTADEFRRIFRALDPLEHAMQIQFGTVDSMSPAQRERHLSQREGLIQQALAPSRYETYSLTRDPLFRQAQMMAAQYGAPSTAILPIYRMSKLNETKRQQILNNAKLSAQEKAEAISRVNQEQWQDVMQIVTGSDSQRN